MVGQTTQGRRASRTRTTAAASPTIACSGQRCDGRYVRASIWKPASGRRSRAMLSGRQLSAASTSARQPRARTAEERERLERESRQPRRTARSGWSASTRSARSTTTRPERRRRSCGAASFWSDAPPGSCRVSPSRQRSVRPRPVHAGRACAREGLAGERRHRGADDGAGSAPGGGHRRPANEAEVRGVLPDRHRYRISRTNNHADARC